MKKLLHVAAYPCEVCGGPVLAASISVHREDQTEIKPIGAVCIACTHRQPNITKPGTAKQFQAIEWE